MIVVRWWMKEQGISVKLMKTRHFANHICYKVTLSLKTGVFGRRSAYKS